MSACAAISTDSTPTPPSCDDPTRTEQRECARHWDRSAVDRVLKYIALVVTGEILPRTSGSLDHTEGSGIIDGPARHRCLRIEGDSLTCPRFMYQFQTVSFGSSAPHQRRAELSGARLRCSHFRAPGGQHPSEECGRSVLELHRHRAICTRASFSGSNRSRARSSSRSLLTISSAEYRFLDITSPPAIQTRGYKPQPGSGPGGRSHSEAFVLRLADVDWDQSRLRVRSPKRRSTQPQARTATRSNHQKY